MTTTREIPFFNYRGTFAAIEPELTATFRDVVSRGAFILQQDLRDFESACAQYLGVRHAFGVGNATDGLHLALRAAGLREGDEVLVPAHTMIATPSAIHFAGGIPVPVDIGPDHMMDPGALEPAITPRTRFIMPVQLNGRTCDMDRIQAVATKHSLTIVEDAAQALGSRFGGQLAGTFGAASAFSFYPAKVLGCLGDGGLAVTNDDGVADRLHQLRDHGRNRDGEVVGWGLNSRLDNLQAAFLHLQLKRYDAAMQLRRTLAAAYHEELGTVPEVVLPPGPNDDARHFDVFQNFEMEAERRDALQLHLKSCGVGTLIQWGGQAIHQHPKLGLKAHVPVTDRFFTRCLMLPMNTLLTRDDIAYISACIRGFYGR